MKTVVFWLIGWLCAISLFAQPKQDVHLRCRPGVYRFQGTLQRGQTFSRNFGGFVFALVPQEYGWSIVISQGQQHDLQALTGPLHFVPNPTDIEGWHFRNAANTGPNTGDVNAPDETRSFLFSPRWPHCEDAEGLDKDGQGVLEITDMELGNLVQGGKANMLMMKFTVKLTVGRSACATCPSHPH
jgi:hypothetical protein